MVARNIVSDYGAVGDGVTDDAQKFDDFHDANQGVEVDLTIPGGGNEYLFNSIPTNAWARGIPVLNVFGTGATLTIGASGGMFLGGEDMDPHKGIAEATGLSARINTVSAGATTVTLTAASASAGYISRFNVGRYMCVTGYDTQGLFESPNGFPPNFQYFDYVEITGVDTVAKTVSFTPPLRYSYRSDWPLMNEGNAFEIDAGGPASIYALAATWDTEVDYDGLTIDSPANQIKASGRSVTYRNCTFPGNIPFPSMNGTFRLIDCNLPNTEVEGDKLADTVICEGGTHKQWKFQSSSIRLFQLDGVTITGGINGTPLHTVIDNCSMASLLPGAIAHGVSRSLICRNSTVSALNVGGFVERGNGDIGFDNYATMADGVITIPNNSDYFATRAFPPNENTVLFWTIPGFQTIGSFRVLGVTQDASNVYVQTDQSGGFPPFSDIDVRTHPCPNATFENVTGCEDVVDLSQAAARGRPIYSYTKRTYDGTSGGTGASPVTLWGHLVSLKVNVITPYTGAQGTLTVGLAQFDNVPVVVNDATTTYGPRFNLKIAGERVITVGSTIGAQSGDTNLDVDDPMWFANTIRASISANISGESSSVWPSFTIEAITDHGVLVPTVVPLRLRLKAA